MHVVPSDVKEFLRVYGGVNPYGKPLFRLIVASDRLVKEAGVYRDWNESLSVAERTVAPGVNNRPDRVVTEMREVCKYPHLEGWILEKWFPASTYGTRDAWEGFLAVDGFTPCLGPYPSEGDYEVLLGPWPRVPAISTLRAVIRDNISAIENRVGTPESRAREYINRKEWEAQQKEERRKEEIAYELNDSLSPMKSSSLGASRWRNEVAKRAGITEHIGIV